jgi:hypothetical protein
MNRTSYGSVPSRRDEIQSLLQTPIQELIPHLNRDQLLELLKKYFLDVQGVMFITGLTRTHLWKLRREGKLKACQNTGRTLLFTLDAVLECFRPQSTK